MQVAFEGSEELDSSCKLQRAPPGLHAKCRSVFDQTQTKLIARGHILSPAVMSKGCLDGYSCAHSCERQCVEKEDLFTLIIHVIAFHDFDEGLSKL